MTSRRGDRGQAVVELALALPVVCVLLTMVLQVAVLGVHRLSLELAAREAARAAVVAADRAMATAASAAAERSTALRPLAVDLRRDGDVVTVTVGYSDPTDVPLAGPMLPEIDLRATVTMAIEPLPSGVPSTATDPADSVADDATGGA